MKCPSHRKICVTGASGFLVSHILILLLSNDNIVHATTRNVATFQTDCLPYLREQVPEKIDQLILFEICDYDFQEALCGCDFLIHCASPVILTPFENDADNVLHIIDPSVTYTEKLLRSIPKGMQKVVFTSSTCSIFENNAQERPFERTDWADERFSADPYSKSKILSEKKAWEIYHAQESGSDAWQLIVLNPGRILGPVIYKNKVPESFCSILRVICFFETENNCETENECSSFCDVRDVAAIHAHFLCEDVPVNRYIVSFEIVTMKYYFRLIQKVLIKTFDHKNPSFREMSSFSFSMKDTWPYLSSHLPIPFEHSLRDSLNSIPLESISTTKSR